MPRFKTIFGALLIAAYLGIGGFVLAGFLDHHGMVGCPLMLGAHALCAMSGSEHAAALQAMVASTAPLLFSFAVLAACAFRLAVRGFRPPARPPCPIDSRAQAVPPPLQELFSAGILHPKSP